MTATIENLDRRVTILEKAAETERNIVRAVSEIVAGSEKRLTVQMQSLQEEVAHVRAEMGATEQRLNDRMGATERRIVDVVNERLDAVMVAIDRLHNHPE